MRHFQSILFVLCILAGISSCNTISDEWQNFVSSGLSDSTEVHTCTLYLDAARPSFDEKESGNTRASGGRWEDGDVVYLRISESVYGQGVYSARNSTWTFEYVGSINASEGDCQTFYLGGYQNFDKFSTKIYVNEHTSIYGDTRAKYKYMNGALYLTSNLAPTCCRMRMKGLEDSQKVTIREDENLVFFESMNLQEGTFSLVSKDVVISDVGNSYTEYVYLSSAAADPILTLVSEGKAYRRTLSAKYFSVGESGVLNVPTLSSHFGWDEVLCVAKLVDGLAFNESIKRLANGDDIKEDKYLTYPDYTIQEIVFDCGSNVSSGTLVSSMDSDVPIYANYSNGVIVVSTIAQMIETFTLNRIFDHCHSLISVDLSNLDTHSVTDMNDMFRDCESLTNLDLSNFDTHSVTDMSGMFVDCESLTNLDLSNFNTRNVTDMYGMFDGCINVTKLKLGNCFEIKFESHSFFGDMSSLVGSCSIYCSEFIKNELIKPYVLPSDLKIDWIIDAKAIIEGSEFNKLIKRLANGENRINHFLDEDNVIQEIIFDCGSSVSSETIVSTWDSDVPIYANYSNGVVTISTLANYIMPTSMNAMFAELRSLRSIDLRCFDTRNVRNMGLMFNGCKSLTNLDVSNFDTRNVEYMWDMFFGCSSLTSLDLTSFDTRNVTFIDAMFLGCSNLSSLNLSNFDIRNVTNLYAVFADCTNLTYLDLSNVDTSNVTNMDHLFSGCSRLSSLNLGPLFVINENVDTSEMFAEACSQAGSCSVSCLEATKKTIQNSTRFPTDVSFTWNILDN